MRQRREQFASDPAEVDRILAKAGERASEIAAPVMERLRKAIGLR
jgi:tryptophanyl-tRNA synthetase